MLKSILSQVKEYKLSSILCPFFVIIEVACDIAIPYLMSLIVDDGIGKKDINVILYIGGLLVLTIFIAFFSGIISGYFATKASAGLAKNLRFAMFKNIQNFAFEDIESFSTGSLITRITNDVSNVQSAFQMSIRMAFRSPLLLIFSLIMSMRINTRLALNFLIIFPILIVGLSIIITKVFPVFSKVFKSLDRMNTIVSENLSAIRVVKSFNREDHESEKFEKISEKLYRYYTKAFKYMALVNPLMQFSVYLVIILLAWFGSSFIIDGSLTTGKFLSLVSYSFQIQISLMLLSFILVQIIMSRNSVIRISELLNKNSSLTSPTNGIKDIENGDIEFKNVSFSYSRDKDKLALKNINLKINNGDVVGIIGQTGSSKSTLISLIPRLYDTLDGSVLVSNRNVRDYDLKSLRESVSIVLQKNILFSGSVLENIRWGNENASLDEVMEVAKIAQAHDFIMQNPEGYNSKVERGGVNFSGGQRQRLTIARALLKNPKILILDDSTSALDSHTERNFIGALSEKRPNLTKIIISQKINSIKNCDYIIVMDKGEISQIGSHSELLENSEIYRDISTTQSKDGDFDEIK